MIFRFVRTSKVNEWLKRNYPSSIVGSAGDNWKKFLSTHGGTGSTFHDLEQSYLANNEKTIFDRWSKFLSTTIYTGSKFLDNIRAYFEGIVDTGGSPSTTEIPIFFFIIPQ